MNAELYAVSGAKVALASARKAEQSGVGIHRALRRVKLADSTLGKAVQQDEERQHAFMEAKALGIVRKQLYGGGGKQMLARAASHLKYAKKYQAMLRHESVAARAEKRYARLADKRKAAAVAMLHAAEKASK